MDNGETQSAREADALPIEITGLTKKYGSTFALNNVDLNVHSGEFLTLLGPSGSGKTTLLMAIAGFNRPDAGSIRFGDTEMILTPPHKRDVGMVFQSYALFPHMSVADNIAFPLKLRGIDTATRDKQVAEALATVQLSGYGERGIDQLSGGQRQRVALARAFVFGPRILLMDEPLSALDKKLREQMQIELKHLHKQLGVTTVYVTHDQREALTMSDRIAVINEGELSQVGTPGDIYNKPANEFVADFIGESTMLPLSTDSDYRLVFGDQVVASQAEDADKSYLLVVRPERLSLLNDQSMVSSYSTIVFSGTVREFVYQGDTAFASVDIGANQTVSVRYGTDASAQADALQSGQAVKLTLERSNAIVIAAANAASKTASNAT